MGLHKSAGVVLPPPDLLVPRSSESKRHALYLPNRSDILALVQERKDRKEPHTDSLVEAGKRPLGELYGQRKRFTATFEREGRKRAYRGYGTLGQGYDATVLFRDVKDETGRMVADHLWFNLTEGFSSAEMTEGDLVSFDARVDDYLKGYEKDSYDYKLSRPTKIVNHGRPKE